MNAALKNTDFSPVYSKELAENGEAGYSPSVSLFFFQFWAHLTRRQCNAEVMQGWTDSKLTNPSPQEK
jgi:hypothetical protein